MKSKKHTRSSIAAICERIMHPDAARVAAERVLDSAARPQGRGTAGSVYWIADLDSQKVEYVSQSYARIWGRSCKSLYANPRSFLDAIHPSDRDRVIAHLEERQRAGMPVEQEYRIVRPDRMVRWILDRQSPLGSRGERLYAGIAQDITDRKTAEHVLLRHNSIVESSADAIISTNLEGVVTAWNESAEQMFGYSAQEVIGKSIMRIVPMERAGEEAELLNRVAGGEKISTLETIRRHQNGSVLDVALTVSPVRDLAGSVTGAAVIFREITEEKLRNAAMQESERCFAAAFEMSTTATAHAALDGTLLRVNPALCRLMGNSRDELLGRRLEELTCAEDRADDAEQLRELLGGRTNSYMIEKRLARRDDFPVWVEFTASLVRARDGSPRYLIAEMRDITARRSLEAQLRQVQKLEPVGQLAAGVAHDFNNVLAYITMRAELSASYEELPPKIAADLEQIKAAAVSASHLTRQLLMFSRSDAIMQPQHVDLNVLVKGSTKMLQRFIGEDVFLDVSLHPERLSVHLDPGIIDQVLLNLAVNARDAMPSGGRLTIKTNLVTFTTSDDLSAPEAHPGSYACLHVNDTGGGIATEQLPRIFDPFFTTKQPGKGTGLGLAMVLRAVKQNHGWIDVKSEVGRGTAFAIYLPVVAPEGAVSVHAPIAASLPRGSETIMLVEDESSVRFTARMLLEQYGYKVYEATSGVHALELWNDHADEIGLLITDMIMPDGINGRQLAEQLLVRRPDLKVIYTTGYSADISGSEITLREGQNFLAKPWGVERLLGAIRQTLRA